MIPRLQLTTSVLEVCNLYMLSLTERKPMGVGAAVVHTDRLAFYSKWVAPTSSASPSSNGSWPSLYSLGTDRTENTATTALPLLCLLWPLPSNSHCLQSHYLATAVVWLLILWSLPSNGSMCHSITDIYFALFLWSNVDQLLQS
jgi:hypothetical protein